MSIQTAEITWLAGLLEGEGCFFVRNSGLGIMLAMTDYDVVAKAAQLLGGLGVRRLSVRAGCKQAYGCSIYGGHAIGWMMTLYQFMGERRKAKIREVIAAWKQLPGRIPKREASCHPGRPHKARGLCNSCYNNAALNNQIEERALSSAICFHH